MIDDLTVAYMDGVLERLKTQEPRPADEPEKKDDEEEEEDDEPQAEPDE